MQMDHSLVVWQPPERRKYVTLREAPLELLCSLDSDRQMSFFRVPLGRSLEASLVEQTAAGLLVHTNASHSLTIAGAVGGTLLYYEVGQPAVKEFVRPERRMRILTSLSLTGFGTYKSFSLHRCQLVSSLQGEKAVWCEIPGVDPTVNQVEK